MRQKVQILWALSCIFEIEKKEEIANIFNRNRVRNNVCHLVDPREPADDEDDPVIKLNASG